MKPKRQVQVFTAGCVCCDEAVALVRRLACSSCEVTVFDMELESTIKQAKELGIRRVPAIVVDGKIADCCAGAVNEQTLRNAGIGSAI